MHQLKRSISLPFFVFYGLGTILGAGIYVLIGQVAGIAGMAAPWSFLIAAIIAGFTAYSYAELSTGMPLSAGEAAYVHEAFRKKWLSQLVGWLIVATGLISAATIANGFVGYLEIFIEIERGTAIAALVLILGILAVWGIQESVIVATVITLLEVGGLFYVLWFAGDSVVGFSERVEEFVPDWTDVPEIGVAAFLAFYAYIGFEDMVNIAEEVKHPERNLRRGIALALILSTLLYLVIAFVAVLALPISELSQSKAPLAAIVKSRGGSVTFIGLVSLLAVVNGALVQIIMAARVLYGMAKQGLTHSMFSHVHHYTQTPVTATVVVALVVLFFALYFDLITLARLTSFIILIVFALVNVSLFVIQKRGKDRRRIVPVIGAILCVALLTMQLARLG